MLEDFGVISKDRTAMTPTSRHDLVHALQDFLSSLVPLGAHAVVIVDEAQHMQPDVLEQMRLIANVQNERGTLLQLILVGQTDLDALLAQPSLRQLSQRVSRVVRLEPLSEQELPKYIQHRLGVARAPAAANSNFPGARELERELAAWDVPSPDFPFTPEAVATIGRISHGIPRVVNLLCDRALEAASSQQLPTVDAPMIAAAAQALALPALEPVAVTPLPAAPQIERMEATDDAGPVQRKPPAARLYALVATVVALAVVAIWLGVRALSGPSPGETPPAQPAPRPQPAAPPPSAPPPAPPPPAAAAPSAAPSAAPAAGAPASAAAAPATASPPPRSTVPPAAAPTAPPPRAAGSSAAAQSAADGFEIVVASFRTSIRAGDVTTAIAQMGEPVHQRTTGVWQQVVAGPYPSADRAREAQQRLERAGFTGTHITPAVR